MFKQLFLPLIAVGLFITLVGFLTQVREGKRTAPFNLNLNLNQPTPTPNRKTIKVGDREITIDVADSNSERQKGLSGRSSLSENEGMLFIFDQKDTMPSFWMKDMNFAIDIIWIDDGKVEKVEKNVKPEPGVSDNKLKIYYSGSPIDYALEVPAGFSDKNSISIGTSIDLMGL